MRKDLFYNWVPVDFHLITYVILLIFLSLINGVSSSASVYIIGSFSSISADITMASYAYPIGLVCAIPFISRLHQYLPGKTILISSILLITTTNIGFAYSHDTIILVMGSFVFGFVKMIALLEILIQLLPLLMPKGERYRLYAVYYFLSVVMLQIGGWIGVVLADRYSWHHSQMFFVFMGLISLFIVIMLMHNNLIDKKVPFYQFDWLGTIFISGFLLLINFILSYGLNENWYQSNKIKWATIGALFFLNGLLLRTSRFKRPFIDIDVFKYKNVNWGILILFFMGLFYGSTNLQNSYMTILFRNNPLENSLINLYMIIGFVVGNIICYLYYTKFNDFKLVIAAACGCYIIAFIILYNGIGLNTGPGGLYLAMFFKGMGNIMYYIAIALYMANNIPQNHFFSVTVLYLAFRNFIGPAVWGCLISNFVYKRTIAITDLIAIKMDRSNSLITDRFNSRSVQFIYNSSSDERHANATIAVFKDVQIQASLLAIRETMGYIIIIGFLLMVIILLVDFYQEIEKNNHMIMP